MNHDTTPERSKCTMPKGTCPYNHGEEATPEWEKEFDEKFYESEKNSVNCKKHHSCATPYEVKQFISSLLPRTREEAEQRGRDEAIKKIREAPILLMNFLILSNTKKVAELICLQDLLASLETRSPRRDVAANEN